MSVYFVMLSSYTLDDNGAKSVVIKTSDFENTLVSYSSLVHSPYAWHGWEIFQAATITAFLSWSIKFTLTGLTTYCCDYLSCHVSFLRPLIGCVFVVFEDRTIKDLHKCK